MGVGETGLFIVEKRLAVISEPSDSQTVRLSANSSVGMEIPMELCPNISDRAFR